MFCNGLTTMDSRGNVEMRLAIETLYAGALASLGPQGVPSGIRKRALPGPWQVTRTGLVGDRQGDTRHHGGPEKALHHYARDHYAAWREEDRALCDLLASPPAFGENISTVGATEEDVCLGDTYALGEVLLQVSQARQPCWRLNLRFERGDMALRVQTSGRTGWYYRVLREGWIATGSELVLVERPRPEWPLARVLDLLYRHPLERAALAELAEVPELTPSWRGLATRRLKTGKVESWDERLYGKS